MNATFDLDRFIEDCRAAVHREASPKAIEEIVAEAVSDPAGIARAIGEPMQGGVQKIYCDDDLTIINPNWAPRMSVMPHDHRMWAVIGIFGGQEDNIFYRRRRQTITQQNAKVLEQGDTIILGPQAIHSVSNPLDKITAAIHVYGGNFFTKPRSEWDPETLAEMPYDVEKTMRLFEEANSQQSPT